MRSCSLSSLTILLAGCVAAGGQLQYEYDDLFSALNNRIDETLSEIQHYTIQDGTVDISLSRESFPETCYIIPPDGEMLKTEGLNMEGVTVQKMSPFVSCRVTIGPINRNMIGQWNLCGKSNKMRCQPVTIQWNNVKRPNTRWTTTTRLKVNHPVNYGGTVNTGVAENNNLVTCHVVTPYGEDLVLKTDMKYPHITRTEISNSRLCAAVFDINADMLGEWVIYGMFRFKKGQNEIRLPLDFFLYNPEEPYEQAYNITVEAQNDRPVSLGETVVQKITGRGKVDSCAYITPTNEEFDLSNSENNNQVTIKNLDSEVACELTINHMTREFVGSWQFIAKFSDGNLFNEQQNVFNLVEKASPVEQERQIEYLQALTITTTMDTTHRIVINKTDTIENKSCHLITPDHQFYKLTEGFHVPGIMFLERINSECGVILNLQDDKMIGRWTLLVRGVRSSTPIERRLPITIRVQGPAEQERVVEDLPALTISTTMDTVHRIVINKTDTIKPESCHLITPDHQIYELTEGFHVPGIKILERINSECGVILNLQDDKMIGRWTLIARGVRSSTPVERRLPITISIEGPPVEQERVIEVLPALRIRTTMDTTHRIVINKTDTIKPESCHIMTPDRQMYEITEGFHVPGIKILERINSECGVILNLQDEKMIGRWTLIARGVRSSTPVERRLPITILVEGVAGGQGRVIEVLPMLTITTTLDTTHRIVINKTDAVEPESCHLMTPDRQLYELTEGFHVPGIKILERINSECGVILNIQNDKMFGRWTLVARGVRSSTPVERRLPITISVESSPVEQERVIEVLPALRIRTTMDTTHRIVINKTDTIKPESCHIMTPDRQMYELTEGFHVPGIKILERINSECGVILNLQDEKMIGRWTLIARGVRSSTPVERRLPITILVEGVAGGQGRVIEVLPMLTITTTLDTTHRIVINKTDAVEPESCHLMTPDRQLYELTEGFYVPGIKILERINSECGVILNLQDEKMFGRWTLIARGVRSSTPVERRLPITISAESPPVEQERVIEVLPALRIRTTMDTTHRIVINKTDTIKPESCHIMTPDRQMYEITEGFHVPGIKILERINSECGVILNLQDEKMVGRWTLIARGVRSSTPVERRLPITILVEGVAGEQGRVIEVLPMLTITTTLDTTHRIVINKTDAVEPESCHLMTPDRQLYELTEGFYVPGIKILERINSECGVILNLHSNKMIGRWTLIARGVRSSTPVERRLPITIRVEGVQPISIDNQLWNAGESVDVILGPSDAVYCKTEDNRGHIVYDNFGPCNIALNRVAIAHRGIWKMHVALRGNVQLQEIPFNVEVFERGNSPVVITTVTTEKPAVLLTCSVPSQLEVNACKFRDPQNNILIANGEVGEGGYSFNGVFVSYESTTNNHDCTLRLTNPSVQDLGIWRCAMDTSAGTFYGFLTVICPFAMSDPNVAATVITEPVLQPESTEVAFIEDEPVELSCFVPAPIRYCYFRDRNGTVYNVFPGMSTSNNFGYLGSGLDAGDCGIWFNSLTAVESGNWSCHVGLFDTSALEQRVDINVTITAPIEVQLIWQDKAVIVGAVVNAPYTMDHCRFVRMDGEGFTTKNVPERYTLFSSTSTTCSLLISKPDIIDIHPWTIVVKIAGENREISATTGHLFGNLERSSSTNNIVFWMLVAIVCMIPIIIATAFIPKRSRHWTQKRASEMRNSFRQTWDRKFHKEPIIIVEGKA